MKRINKLISLLLILISFQSNAQLFNTTITYKLFSMDSDIWGKNETEIRTCEEVLISAVNRVKKNYSQFEIKNAEIPVAVNILKMIDSTLTEFRFLYFSNISDIHFDYLTPAFRDSYKAADYLFGENSNNKYRKAFWSQNQLTTCFLIDCDQYCQVYYGIAQMLSLPLHIVETPYHNYLRWRMNDGKYFCWDTNEGEVHFDETTVTGYNQINKNNRSQFLQDWTVDDIVGHYHMLRGEYYFFKAKKSNINKSITEYMSAMSLRPNISMIYCNYVWIYIMNPELKDYNDSLLMAYINKAMVLEENLNFYDAKACLYAIRGDFKKAIEIEKQGLKLKTDPYGRRQKAESHLACFMNEKVCRELK